MLTDSESVGSLPHRLLLLSHDPSKGRFEDGSAAVRGPLLRAAAIADLRVAGLLRDRDGGAERPPALPAPPSDPFLAKVWGDTSSARRSWYDLISHHAHRAERTVRDQLVAAGVLAVERRRILYVLPADRIRVCNPGPVRTLRNRVRTAVVDGLDPATVPIGDAVLVVLVTEGGVGTVFGRRELAANRPATRSLVARVDRELPRLRKALTLAIAAARTPSSA